MRSEQDLYKEFIEDASKTYGNALQHDSPDISALGRIYTKIRRMRVLSSPRVVESAERVARAIVDAKRFLPTTARYDGKEATRPSSRFAKACRAEMLGRFALTKVKRSRQEDFST